MPTALESGNELNHVVQQVRDGSSRHSDAADPQLAIDCALTL